MRVCMITPHLPPEQAANALLPGQLGAGLAAHGVETTYVAHPPARQPALPGRGVLYVPRRSRHVLARTRAGALAAAGRMVLALRTAVSASDLVHLHGNGLLIETAALVAEKFGKPRVITLYGTDVWHHDPAAHARFAGAVRGAAARVFYSRGLREFAKPLGLAPDPAAVIYAPVPARFRPLDAQAREALRRELGVGAGPLLLTVKRLHDVAGHDVLLDALPDVLAARAGAALWIAGDGERRQALEARAAALGLSSSVRFLGMIDNEALWRYYAAADLFVLPSRLESWGTVMLEALASGTPVVATDTAGGLEVHEHFPDDVRLAPRENARALGAAVVEALGRGRWVGDATRRRLASDFSEAACAARYFDVYRQALDAR